MRRLKIAPFAACLAISLALIACDKDFGTGKKSQEEATAGATLESSFEEARQRAAELRALSFALRDLPPDRETAISYAKGETSKDLLLEQWLASPAHKERVGRYFDDAFGTRRNPEVIFGAQALVKDGNGWLQSSDNYPQCTSPAQIEELEVWWGVKGGTAAVCSLADCGPYALRCGLVEHRPHLMDAIRFEFRERGIYVYEQNLSWDELYAGTVIFGNRQLLHKYILDSSLVEKNAHPFKANELQLRELLDSLFAVPLDAPVSFSLPGLGPERGGLVSSPAFLQRFNNFRSRIRALGLGLHCQDVGPWMNPTRMTNFINQSSLTSFDLSHGNQENCAFCHLGMDNWGSTLLGWSDQGTWQWWKTWNQTGAVWGIEGEGPRFLMASVLEEKASFHSCMARKAWQSFSQGRPWEILSATEQLALNEAASMGPRNLLQTIFNLDALVSQP